MADIEAFITRWRAAGGTELANYQLFLTDLAALLDLPCPEPATGDPRSDGYVFERPVRFVHGDGTESAGRRFPGALDTGDDGVPEKKIGGRKLAWHRFTGGTKRAARVAQILDMLTALGRAQQTADGRFAGNG